MKKIYNWNFSQEILEFRHEDHRANNNFEHLIYKVILPAFS